ncbi:MAG: DNA ligase D [Planctomycetota bacterium]|nr:MAG: DNA ligase D [Planctomycetota bacterium]
MSLATYHRRRNFRATSEPRGKQPARKCRDQVGLFVVQKHAARRLHYDFRLEIGGVLKSWAVPKGPSLDPSVRALAVHVEDHPLEYAQFEGTIPKPEYGAGTVIVWDRGTWRCEGDAIRQYRAGNMTCLLVGEKLRGAWKLVRMRGRNKGGNQKADNWFLKKVDDAWARKGPAATAKLSDRSVASGRTLEEVAEERPSGRKTRGPRANAIPRELHERLEASPRRSLPRSFAPQLATLATDVPSGGGWLHEIKFDGYRILAFCDNGQVRLRSRRGNDWSQRFETIAAALSRSQFSGALFDGEVVVLGPDGRTDFQTLQNLMRRGNDADVVYYLFDLPFYRGHDVTDWPLVDRKRLLAAVLASARPKLPACVRLSDHIVGSGEEVAEHACRYGLEGIVSKRADSPYVQKRSADWLKVKCLRRQEFVVGGWTDRRSGPAGIGSLLLGFYRGADLVYCGRVGTGFTAQTQDELLERLKPLAAEGPPFASQSPGYHEPGTHYIRPEIVVEVQFGEWTEAGILRHAAFKGIREDKPPRQVGREEARAASEEALAMLAKPRQRGPKANASRQTTRAHAARSPRAAGSPAVAGVRITHGERVVYPDLAVTKLDVARYYDSVAEAMLPHVEHRPLMVVRCPEGQSGACFHQKHVRPGMPKAIKAVMVREKDENAEYASVGDRAGLVTLVQFGALEVHVWGSRDDRIDRPDRLIFDLDPGVDVAWKEVVRAARELKARLEDAGLQSFARTTGGKGVHLVAPVVRRYRWEDVKAFARSTAEAMTLDAPDRYIATASKARRQGRIYIDYLRNDLGSTAVASFSTRARPGAPVATPLAWDELNERLDPLDFNVRTVPERLARLSGDPWRGLSDLRQSIRLPRTHRAAARAKRPR